MNKFGKIFLSGLFIIFIFIFGMYMLVTPDNDISNTENRELAQVPDINSEAIVNGEYMKDVEEYFTDQFPARDVWLKAYVDYQRITNRTYISDHFVTDDDWILAKPSYSFLKKEIDRSTEKLNDFGAYLKEKNMELYYFSAPHKLSVLQSILPEYIKEGSYLKNIDYFMSKLDTDKVVPLDMTNAFLETFSEEEIKEMYFKTDHHWNANGAMTGYKMIEDTLFNHSSHFPKEKMNENIYEEKCLPSSKQFLGSYNRQLYMTVNAKSENMCMYVAKDNAYADFEVTLGDKEIDPFQLYGRGFGNENNTIINYSEIFTFNKREINIINKEKKDEDNKILIIKDSYANPMVYHIAQNFYKTTIYDPRYNEDRTVYEFIEQNDFDIVALVYNSAHLEGENYNFKSFPK